MGRADFITQCSVITIRLAQIGCNNHSLVGWINGSDCGVVVETVDGRGQCRCHIVDGFDSWVFICYIG